MRLKDMQSQLADAFRRFDPLTEVGDKHDLIAELVSGNERLTPHEQAEIYREQFWFRHRDVLYDDYPGLSWWLGEEAFEAFARAYLLAYPPDSYTLRDLGNHIAAFADSYFEDDGVARDLAHFELAFIDVFDGADSGAVSADALKKIAPEQWEHAKLILSPLLRVVPLRFPVDEIRQALKREEEPSRDMEASAYFVAIWRDEELQVRYRRVARAEWMLIDAFTVADQTLGDALELVAAELDEPEQKEMLEKLQIWFQGWGTRGWINAVHVTD